GRCLGRWLWRPRADSGNHEGSGLRPDRGDHPGITVVAQVGSVGCPAGVGSVVALVVVALVGALDTAFAAADHGLRATRRDGAYPCRAYAPTPSPLPAGGACAGQVVMRLVRVAGAAAGAAGLAARTPLPPRPARRNYRGYGRRIGGTGGGGGADRSRHCVILRTV